MSFLQLLCVQAGLPAGLPPTVAGPATAADPSLTPPPPPTPPLLPQGKMRLSTVFFVAVMVAGASAGERCWGRGVGAVLGCCRGSGPSAAPLSPVAGLKQHSTAYALQPVPACVTPACKRRGVLRGWPAAGRLQPQPASPQPACSMHARICNFYRLLAAPPAAHGALWPRPPASHHTRANPPCCSPPAPPA